MKELHFLIFCIGSRLLLAYLAYKYPSKILAYPAILLAISWMVIWLFSLRKTGMEVVDNNNIIWWDNMRPIHAIIYALFAYSSYTLNNNAYGFLVFDALLGLSAFLLKKKLFI